MRYLSVCSGIEAASVAWHSLGWTPAAFSEIEPFPRAVLQHHYPEVPLHGDFTTIGGDEYGAIDLLVGGTPCQSFSVAGLRGGLADDRGNLALEFLRLAQRTRPRWVVWENVPGVLSSNGGRDFGSILGGLVELGYGFSYRVLDAQYFGVPQRRRRVFVVGHIGDWRPAAAVLFERHSLQGNSAPRREAGERVANALTERADRGGTNSEGQRLITHSLRGEGFDASEDGTGRGTPLVPVAFSAKDYGGDAMADLSPTLRAGGHSTSHANAGVMPAIAFHPTQDPITSDDGTTHAMGTGSKGGCATVAVANAMAVRRLTPRECERLQGFPDDWTLIPYRGREAADGPRYKAIGNSMAVPVMRWIGQRIQMVLERD